MTAAFFSRSAFSRGPPRDLLLEAVDREKDPDTPDATSGGRSCVEEPVVELPTSCASDFC